MSKTVAYLTIGLSMFSACAPRNFTPTKPVKPNADWAVPAWQQPDRKFEQPYEAPENIYQSYRTATNSAKVASAGEATDASTKLVSALSASAPKPKAELQLYDQQLQTQTSEAMPQLNKQQVKKMGKLQAKLDKRFNEQRGDGFGTSGWTKLAIIVAIVAGAGLLAFLLGGWFFGLFLFILGGAALVCKWTGILDF